MFILIFRNFVGTLKGFDQRYDNFLNSKKACFLNIVIIFFSSINLILEDTHERVYSTNAGVEQVVLGLHLVRGDNIAVIGEVDEEIDKRIDLNNVRAEPIASIVRG